MNEKTSATVYHLPLPSSRLANPFRPGSKKAACFDLFAKGGTRDELLANMVAIGIAGTTARTWLTLFRTLEQCMREARKSVAAKDLQQPER